MSARRNSGPLKWASFHEAGHAVAKIRLRYPATNVEIRPDGSGLTHGTGKPWEIPSARGQYAAWNACVVTLAGPYAEARASHRGFLAVLWGQADYTDFEQISEWLVPEFSRSHEDACERAFGETKSLILRAWPAVEILAAELLRRRFLKAKEVQSLVEAALGEIS